MDKNLLYRILAQAWIIYSSIAGLCSLQTGEDSRVGRWMTVDHFLFIPVFPSINHLLCLLLTRAVHLLKGLGIFVIQDLAFLLSLLNLLTLLLSQSSTWRSWIVSQFRSGVTAEAGWEEKCLDRVAPNPDRKYLFWVMPFSSPGFSSMTGFANMLVELLE